MKRASWASAVVAVAVLAFAGAASAETNSEAAAMCRNGGWETLLRADYTPFSNTGDCVAYAATGGMLTTSEAPALCESYGGAFAAGATADVAWTCTGFVATTYAEWLERSYALAYSCDEEGPDAVLSTVWHEAEGVADAACEL